MQDFGDQNQTWSSHIFASPENRTFHSFFFIRGKKKKLFNFFILIKNFQNTLCVSAFFFIGEFILRIIWNFVQCVHFKLNFLLFFPPLCLASEIWRKKKKRKKSQCYYTNHPVKLWHKTQQLHKQFAHLLFAEILEFSKQKKF